MEIVFFSIFLAVCISGTPADVNSCIGACLAGFILGCFILGEDKQLHSKIFFWFAIIGAILLISLTSWGFVKKTGSMEKNPADVRNKVLEQ
mmetsp:Transcript_5856/g.12332  ORF Transcript_5856/g.12332 Transcript_5856/m.12332 type:complete len:91 (+) Transcript_5856:549-821(+)